MRCFPSQPAARTYSTLAILLASSALSPLHAFDLTSNATSQQTLSSTGGDTVRAGVSVTTSGSTIAIYWSSTSLANSFTNYGTITTTGSGRAFDTNNAVFNSGTFTLNNMVGAILSSSGTKDALRVDGSKVTITGAFVLNNSGTIEQTNTDMSKQATAIDMHKITALGAGGSITINNQATGIIRSKGYDAIQPGAGTTINNYGQILSYGANTKGGAYSTSDGIDIADNLAGVTVNNYAGGLISGARHGVTQGTSTTLTDLSRNLVVTNYGTIIGRNGSGVGSDGSGTVINYGTITGTYAGNGNVVNSSGVASNTGDGDGVDIDYLAKIINYGTIQGTGAAGVDTTDGTANLSEGLSIGGGSVYNARNALISGYGRGIAVVGNSTDRAYYSTTIINEGTIRGLAQDGRGGAAIYLFSNYDNTITNTSTGLISGAGSEAAILVNGTGINTITNAGTITQTGSAAAIEFSNGGSSITNSGTISGATFGILAKGATTISNSGTISGGSGAISFQANGNSLTVNPGARFDGGIFYNGTTGNTLRFGSGSYSLAVDRYTLSGNSTTLGGTGQMLLANGLNSAGSGTLYVVDTGALSSGMAQQGADTARVLSTILGDVLTTDNPGSPEFRPVSGQASLWGEILPQTIRTEMAAAADKTLDRLTLNPAADMPELRQGLVANGYGSMAWSRVFTGLRYVPPSGTNPAQNSSHAGLAAGFDRKVDFGRIGVFAGTSFITSGPADKTASMKTNLTFAGLVARYEFNPWFVDVQAALGLINNSSTRSIAGSGETASGNFTGVMVAPELALGYQYSLAKEWSLTPSLRGRYIGSFYAPFTESGSAQNLSYAAQSVHLLEERAELRLTHTQTMASGLTTQIAAQAALFGVHRLGDDSLSLSLAGTAFSVPSTVSRDLYGASIGVSFDTQFAKGVNVFAGTDASFYTNAAISVSARGGVRISF